MFDNSESRCAMEYDEIDQYVDQLFRGKDPDGGKEIYYSMMIARNGRTRSEDEYWRNNYSRAQTYNQNSLRGLTCAEWILIIAIGIGLLLLMTIKV